MSATFAFPMPLSEKYRPRTVADFVGLDKPKRILSKFAANPYQSAWLFVGSPEGEVRSRQIGFRESQGRPTEREKYASTRFASCM
jgi:hypothetical protein